MSNTDLHEGARYAPSLPPDRQVSTEADAEASKTVEPSRRSKSARRRGEPYPVGYAKPPKATRWKKGVSGNPNGRPRKKPDARKALREVLAERITATIEGELKSITIQEALLLKLREHARRGDLLCIKLVDRVLQAAPEPPQPPRLYHRRLAVTAMELSYCDTLQAQLEKDQKEEPDA